MKTKFSYLFYGLLCSAFAIICVCHDEKYGEVLPIIFGVLAVFSFSTFFSKLNSKDGSN